MDTAFFIRFLESICAEMPEIRRVSGFNRDGVQTVEVIVERGQMVLGGRSLDDAIAQTRDETQRWAVEQGAPEEFEGVPVIYRTVDCRENLADSREIHEMYEHGCAVVDHMRDIEHGRPRGGTGRPPLEAMYVSVACFFTTITGHVPPLFSIEIPDEVSRLDKTVKEYGDAITEKVADDPTHAVELALLLRPAFSAPFKRDFGLALQAAQNLVAAIPQMEELRAMFVWDDEDGKPMDMASYQVVAEAEDKLNSLFSPVFHQHAAEFARLLAQAYCAPMTLGIVPTDEMFWG